MTPSITIELPEVVYQSLSKEAEAKGRKVEEILVERLVKDAPEQFNDPLDEFVGALFAFPNRLYPINFTRSLK